MKMFKNKKTRRRNFFLISIPIIGLMILFGFLSFNSVMNIGKGDKVINSIDSMDYHLRAGATDFQIELFKELAEAVNSEEMDYETIAGLVVENYVADFYTWTNKEGSYDIGGMYYVYSPSKTSIYRNAKDNFYKYLPHYIDEYGSDNLLEVDSIVVEGGKLDDPYILNGEEFESYYYKCMWTYKENDVFNEEDYTTKQYFLLYKNEDGRIEIVQAYGGSQ